MSEKNIVIIGAGVAGLTTALLLSRNPRFNITVAAKHMPGDYDIEYASPWAGANYMPVSLPGTQGAQWEKETWKPLEDLARNHPEAGVHFQECEIRTRTKDSGSTTATWFGELLSPKPWFKDVVPNFRSLDHRGMPGIDRRTAFTSVCINTAVYLPYLMGQCAKNGVTFKRATFKHILDSANPALHAGRQIDLIVNCTGLMASKLGGVEDSLVIPARGQIVLVRNETKGRMIDLSGTDDGDTEACYIMSRALGGGTVLGGTYQKGSWESTPDPKLAIRIMKRAVEAYPELTGGKGIEALDVVRHGVGLRPVREGGTRVEKEKIGGKWVVHNYGAGGAGYQNSYGCAKAAVDLIEVALGAQSKL